MSVFAHLAPWGRGALCGVMTLCASAFVAFFAHVAFLMATEPNSQWGFILGPIAFLLLLFAPPTWVSLIASALIGLFAAAFSEAVDDVA